MHDYRRLRVYDMAIDLIAATYETTARFPSVERFGLTSQMNRTIVSVASNIAQGAGRGDIRDFARFLRIARGSGCELEAQATAAARLGLLSTDGVDALHGRAEQIKGSLARLEQATSRRNAAPGR